MFPDDYKTFVTQGYFKLLENRKPEFRITNLQLDLTTLEEVFLTKFKQKILQNVVVEG